MIGPETVGHRHGDNVPTGSGVGHRHGDTVPPPPALGHRHRDTVPAAVCQCLLDFSSVFGA